MVHIVRTIERPATSQMAEVAKYAPATLHEAQHRRGAIDYRIKPIYPGMRACGPAVTVSCTPGDNMMLIASIEVAMPGDILLVSGGGLREQGGFGEVLATACMARGIAALVTDASVRDGTAIAAMGFPVFSFGLAMRGTVKETVGSINSPIVFGGIHIRPGDVVSGDDDGVVRVMRSEIDEVCEASHAREAKEAKVMQALRDGGSVLELTGIGKVLEKKGCVWE